MAVDDVLRVTCVDCGHTTTRHRVLCERKTELIEGTPPHHTTLAYVYHRFAECMGCGRFKYVTSELDQTYPDAEESNVVAYPDDSEALPHRKPGIGEDEARADGELLIPETVWKIYKETIDALNVCARTLAAGGLRAMVEGVCLHLKIDGRDLLKQIDGLASAGHLTKTQADLLHEERYLGNAALHELATPTAQDLEDGLQIVEGLLRTIFVLPSKAERLRKRREAKQGGPHNSNE